MRRRPSLAHWRRLAVIGVLGIAASDVMAWLYLSRHVSMTRWVQVQDLGSVRPTYRGDVDKPLPPEFVGSDPITLLRAVMNSVRSVGPFKGRDLDSLLEHIGTEGGLLCGGMADLYYHVLSRNGLTARRVSIARNLFDPYDTHQTVEVEVDDRWVIYDPTFHVSFEREGIQIGAQAIKEALLAGRGSEIRAVFLGEVSYPARLGTYYVHWLPLFNNVFVQDPSNRSLAVLLPPLRYWEGPITYYQAPAGRESHVAFVNCVYFVVVALVPLTVILLGGGLLLATWRRWRP